MAPLPTAWQSCLYDVRVRHVRTAPVVHAFEHRFYNLGVYLDELAELDRCLPGFGWNRSAPFSILDRDHLADGKPLLQAVDEAFERLHGRRRGKGERFLLVTFPRVFGHVFNPVSFYFLVDGKGRPVCALAEVGNTFGEIRLYPVSLDPKTQTMTQTCPKQFYVSPFLGSDSTFEFRLGLPGETLDLEVNTWENEKRVLHARIWGKAHPLTGRSLFAFALRVPLATMKVVTLIHWHALRLYLKRVPFFRKSDNPEAQCPDLVRTTGHFRQIPKTKP